MNKEMLHNVVDAISEQQAECFGNILNSLLDRDISRLLKALDISTNNVDFARPISFDKAMAEHGLDVTGIVWDYNDRSFGGPKNIHTMILKRLFDKCKDLYEII